MSEIDAHIAAEARTDPIALAKEIGFEALDYIGAKIFANLEISFISHYLKPLADYPTFRLRQNLFIHGPKGTFKDVLTEQFFAHCVPKSESRIIEKDLTSCSIESFLGSINEQGSKLYYPTFWGCDFALITELLAFLNKPLLKRQIGTLNKIVEGNKTEVYLIKFSNATDDVINEYKNGKDGIFFDGHSLWYYPRVTMIICSHFLDAETIKILDENAFLDRFKLVQYDMTNEQAKALLAAPLKKFNPEKMFKLMEINTRLIQDLPSKDTVLPADYSSKCAEALKKAEDKSIENEVAIRDVYGFRGAGNLIREVVARASVGNNDNVDMDDFIAIQPKVSEPRVFEPQRLMTNKRLLVKNALDSMLSSGSMTSGDILKELQGKVASTETIYSVLRTVNYKQVEYGKWALNK